MKAITMWTPEKWLIELIRQRRRIGKEKGKVLIANVLQWACRERRWVATIIVFIFIRVLILLMCLYKFVVISNDRIFHISFVQVILTYILYIYVMLYQVSSDREPAGEVGKFSMRDANVADANVHPKYKRKLAQKRKPRTSLGRKIYSKIIFANPIIYV